MPKHVRKKTLAQQQAEDAAKALVDAQDMAISLFESSAAQQVQLQDAQDMLIQLFEKNGGTL